MSDQLTLSINPGFIDLLDTICFIHRRFKRPILLQRGCLNEIKVLNHIEK